MTGLVKSYDARRALDGLSFTVRTGVTRVRAPTPLLECLAGIEPYDSGAVVLR